MKNFFLFYIFSNLHLSFSGFILSFGFNYLFFKNQDFLFSLFIALAIFIMYFIQQTYWQNINEESSEQTIWLISHKQTLNRIILFLSFVEVFLIYLISFSKNQFFFLIILILLSFFYVFPRKKSLRKIPYFKNFLISLIWTGTLFVLPTLNNKINILIILIYFTFFIYYLILTILYDIKDIEKDSIKTFSNYFKNYISIFLNLLNISLLSFFISIPFFFELKPYIFIVNFYIFILINFIEKPNKLLYYHFLIDLTTVIFGLILIFQNDINL